MVELTAKIAATTSARMAETSGMVVEGKGSKAHGATRDTCNAANVKMNVSLTKRRDDFMTKQRGFPSINALSSEPPIK